MGAQTFHQQAWNPDLQEAYNSAFGEAQYDHGHSGYTGSLAEKLSFVVIDEVQPLPAADAWDYADELDTSFGTGGIKSFDLVADHAEAFNAVAVAGNSMVVAGSSGSDLIVARLAELYSPRPNDHHDNGPADHDHNLCCRCPASSVIASHNDNDPGRRTETVSAGDACTGRTIIYRLRSTHPA